MKRQLHLSSIPYNKEIGNYFRIKRKKAGLTQLDLGKKLNLNTSQFVSNVERGVCAYSLEHLLTISQACRINKEELIKEIMKHYTICLKKRIIQTKP